MVRNLSFKTDDEFDDKLYSASKKRGMTKSAFMKYELGKIIDGESEKERKNPEISNVNVNNKEGIEDSKELFDDIYTGFIENKKKEDNMSGKINKESFEKFLEDKRKQELSSEPKKEDPKKEEPKPSLDLVPNITNIEPAKLNITTDSYTELPSTPILDSLIAKPATDKPIEKPIDLNIKEISQKPRYVIKKKVNRVTEDEVQQQIDVEKKYRELKEKDKFNETFIDIHNRIRNIDDRVCKDGECTKKELENIKNEIGKLEGLKKNLDTSTSELTNLRKDLTDLKKDLPKVDVCPECGERAALHLSSFCSNCGTEFHEWFDDNGNKVSNWKSYKERTGKK